MKKVTVSNGRDECFVDIAIIEKKYNATFVGMMCLKASDGGWANAPAAIFYQPVPPVKGYSNYLGLIIRDRTVYITSGASAVEPLIGGIMADDGEIIYSQYRHDYRKSKDSTVSIDGGRDYVKSTQYGRHLSLKIIDGEWYELESEDMPE